MPTRVQPVSRRCLPPIVRAFSLVELLVVIAVIIILLGLLVLAINRAVGGAQATNTQALMNSMKQAVIRFQADVGYIPPVLGTAVTPANPNPALDDYRRLFDWRGANFVHDGATNSFGGDDIHPDNPAYSTQLQSWYSFTSPAEYLLGWANHREDGFGIVLASALPAPGANNDWDAENPALGIRDPLDDGVWGATYNGTMSGRITDRMRDRAGAAGLAWGSELNPLPADQGQVLGPYLELKDNNLIGAINGTDANGDPIIVFAGQVPTATFETLPKVVCDYWGRPIHYYRKPYPPGGLTQAYRSGVDRNADGNLYNDRVPTLSDFFVLRPWAFKAGSDVNGLPDADNDTGTTAELEAAEFAFFSAGADKAFDKTRRIDADEFNKDNIVEVGP